MSDAQRLMPRAGLCGLVAATMLCGGLRASADEGQLLEAIGALSATQVYITFGYVGSIADGFADKRYDNERVKDLMAEVDGMIDGVIEQLSSVRADANENDRASIDQIVEVFELLQDEARALSRVAEGNTEQNRQSFSDARLDAWEKVALLLDLPE